MLAAVAVEQYILHLHKKIHNYRWLHSVEVHYHREYSHMQIHTDMSED